MRIGAVVLLVLSAATMSLADDVAPRRCAVAVTETGRLLLLADSAALLRCARRVASGELPAATDCANDAATQQQRDAAAAKRSRRLAQACNDADVAALHTGGDCDGAKSVAQLSACLRASHAAESEQLLAVAAPADAALPAAAQVCAARAGRETAAYAMARLRLLQRCKQSDQRLGLAPGADCSSEPRAARWIAARRSAAAARIVADCPQAALAATPFGIPCDTLSDAADLAACLLDGTATGAVDAALLAELGDAGFCGDGGAAVERRIDALLAQMTVAEKIEQMHGAGLPALNHTATLPRLNIPGLVMVDGPRGVGAAAGMATSFPVGMGRAATWDPALEERVGEAMGRELRAKGGSMLLAPTINMLRHPRWGRAQETYGEDTYLLGRMGVGFIRGAQQHVVANAKHFAVNSIEDTRFNVSVQVDERTLREVYLPHFRAAVQQAHVAAVMSAYNKLNGEYCAENTHLLGEVLKGDWHFPGLVESDWILGTRSTLPSLQAGLDIEMPIGNFFGPRLATAVANGTASVAQLDAAVRRSLRAQLCFRFDTDPPQVDASQISTPEHLALTRTVARESIVLLKNAAAMLPLERGALTSLVVVGPLAAQVNLGDTGSSSVLPATPAVSPLDGLLAHAGSVAVTYLADGPATPADAATIAAAGAVVVVAGLNSLDEGEGLVGSGDRENLVMPRDQDGLIASVAALNARTIVVLEGSGPIILPWIDAVPAVLTAWYPGQEGGHAIAEVLFGDVVPSGKLPLSFPRAEADLPPFDNVSLRVTYDYFHGYRYLDHTGTAPLFPFGHGLSYTSFAYDDLQLSRTRIAPTGRVRISARVTNSGARAAAEVAQLYVGAQGSAVERAVRELKGFTRIELAPGESRRVDFDLRAADLAYWDTPSSAWVVEPLTYRIEVGTSSRDLPLSAALVVAE
ncbi:MAG: glycoside hydrolase family 3 C-terminal domain-containing protein [bacterium]